MDDRERRRLRSLSAKMQWEDYRRRSRERYLVLLREKRGLFSRTPTMKEWDLVVKRPTAKTIANAFGGWNVAWSQVDPEMVPNARISERTFRTRMTRRFERLGRIPSMREWDDAGWEPSARTIAYHYGGWIEAWQHVLPAKRFEAAVAVKSPSSVTKKFTRLMAATESEIESLPISERDKDIVRRIARPQTIQSIADMYGISRERVYQIARSVERLLAERERPSTVPEG